MRNRIGSRRAARLLAELAKGERDVWTIAEEYGLTVPDLVELVDRPEHSRALRAMRKLCDDQARATLSRYRGMAAARLAALAAGPEEGKEREVARRACVDLLGAQVAAEEPEELSPSDEVDPMRIALQLDAARREMEGSGE